MALQAVWLSRLLRDAGHNVTNVPTNALPMDCVWRNIPLLRGILNLYFFLQNLRRDCASADIVHIFSNSYLSFFLFTAPTVLWAKWQRRPVVLHYHGGAAEAFLGRWHHLARPLILPAYAVIVPSSFLQDTFSRFGIKSVVVPNVLTPNIQFRKRERLSPNLVMSRHLEPVYNIPCALHAFRLLLDKYPNASLVVAGGGTERDSLERLALELGLCENVHFTGSVSNEHVHKLYNQADIFLNSSLVDNQPISILEAYACGLPVVSTAAGGIPHLVRDGEDALLARIDDPADLAKQVMRLLSEPELAARLIRNGLARTREFSPTEIYRQISASYEEAMSQ